MAKNKLKPVEQAEPLKLDLGCGKNKQAGFIGVDVRQFEGVDQVVDLRQPWPWKDSTVGEVRASHFVEHLNAQERTLFVNELHRVMQPNAKALIIVPYWKSQRAYGDLTHQWPPVTEMWFYYLSKGWREQNAPHNDFYKCDFNVTWGYSVHPTWQTRNQETQMFAINHYTEVGQDLMATFTALK